MNATALPELEWVRIARAYLGQAEVPGRVHNPEILSMWERIKVHFRDDETPWCAAFVGACLERAGIRSTRSAAARSYVAHGTALPRPAYGCVVVFWRGKPSGWSGHVGFVVGRDKDHNLMVLGGNQNDRVSIAPFALGRVLAYRWPSFWPADGRFDLPVLDSDGRLSTDEA